MKKAKVILSAVAVLAVVGGALAFKAKRTSHPFYSSAANGICSVPVNLNLTTDLNAGIGSPFVTTLTTSTAPLTTTCPTILVKQDF